MIVVLGSEGLVHINKLLTDDGVDGDLFPELVDLVVRHDLSAKPIWVLSPLPLHLHCQHSSLMTVTLPLHSCFLFLHPTFSMRLN